MTEKRFTMIYFETDGNLIFDENKHNGEWYDSTECLQDDEIVELLNNLSDENEQLKQFKNLAIDYNIPLSKLCSAFEDALSSDTVTDLETQIMQLKEENEQLKAKVEDKEVAVEVATEEQMSKVFTIIDEKILECEKAVEDIRYNGIDSYIVKHDVASKILKELKKELES